MVESLYSGLEDVVMSNDVIGNDADSISTMIDTKLVAFNDVMEIEDIVHDVKSNILGQPTCNRKVKATGA